MSKLNELIQELCPNGVEYIELETVCHISKGIQFNKKDMHDEGTYPVINGGINPSGYIEQYNQDENTITISQGGASAGYVNWLTTKFWAGAHCYVLKPSNKVLNRYLFHFVKSKEYKLQECQYGAGIPALAKTTVASIEIPVPPLEVQREIVRILDSFTLLTAELTAELTARKKQYEYYRDELLTFDISIPFVPLSELCDIGDGLHSTPKYNYDGEYYFINGNNLSNGRIVFDSKTKRISNDEYERIKIPFGETLLYSINGTIGNIALYNNENIALGKSAAYFTITSDKLLLKYLFYILQSKQTMSYFEKNLTGSTIKNLGLKTLRDYKIALPSLDVQKRLVDVLDNFDAICSDLNIGLPAEIEARQKQYEFYRDKLLTFKQL